MKKLLKLFPIAIIGPILTFAVNISADITPTPSTTGVWVMNYIKFDGIKYATPPMVLTQNC